jgi:beta-ureidopropionase
MRSTRRDWISFASAGLGAAALPLPAAVAERSTGRLPREVWAASVSREGIGAVDSQQAVQVLLERMEQIVPLRPDIVCTPETFAFSSVKGKLDQVAETPGAGPVSRPFAEFARKHKCYVICCTYTKDAGRCYNSAIVFDRSGGVLGEYRKMHPTIDEMGDGVVPGPVDPPVFKTDFGTIGIQICFDINWPDSWRKLRRAGAEVVFWPSAYGGGTRLNAHACENNFPVVSSTHKGTTKVCDMTGEEIASAGWVRPWLCVPLNLERAVVHAWPFCEHNAAIQAKYGDRIRIRILTENEWMIFESLSPDVKIAQVLKEFDIPTLEQYLAKSDAAQAAQRP